MLVGRDKAAFCGSSASCPSALKSVRLFPRRRYVSPALRFPRAAATCACATSWARYSMTAGPRVCSPHAAARRKAPWRLALVTLFQFPRRIGAEAWFDHWEAERYEVHEQTVRTADDEILTLLRIDDKDMLR